MNSKTYITAAIIGVLVIGILVAYLWSSHRIRSLETEVDAAKTIAAEKQNSAIEAEKAAAEYKQKIEYLEQELGEARALATKPDDEIENFKTNTGVARRDVERVRRVRSVAGTTEELCRKLAEVGHPCEQELRLKP
jgi:hypothetical protein